MKKFISWLTVPPAVAILTYFIVRILCGTMTIPNAVDSSIWAMTVLLFVVLSASYCMFIIHNWYDGLLPVQLLAQGLLLCPLALSFGAKIFQWVGILLAVCGAAALSIRYHQQQMQQALRFQLATETGENMDSRLPIPFVVTDPNGIILLASKPILSLANKTSEAVFGQYLGALLELMDDGTAKIGEKNYTLIQGKMDGGCYYFQVTDTPKPAENENTNENATSESGSSNSNSNIDPETELMTMDAAITRLGEEIYRTRRYGHQLTTGLIRLVFPADFDKDGSAKAAFKAWCTLVGKNLREPDIVAASGPRDIILALPECPKAAANAVIQKLLMLITSVADQHPAIANITPLYVYTTYEGSDTVPDAKELVEKLSQDLAQKYTLNKSDAQGGQ